MNYTDFWSVAYGVDVTSFDTTWDEIFPNGYSTTGGYDPCQHSQLLWLTMN